jgi:hypothetical protein
MSNTTRMFSYLTQVLSRIPCTDTSHDGLSVPHILRPPNKAVTKANNEKNLLPTWRIFLFPPSLTITKIVHSGRS